MLYECLGWAEDLLCKKPEGWDGCWGPTATSAGPTNLAGALQGVQQVSLCVDCAACSVAVLCWMQFGDLAAGGRRAGVGRIRVADVPGPRMVVRRLLGQGAAVRV